MMRIRHVFPGTSSRSQVENERAFFMRNQAGDMASFTPSAQTRYGGWFVRRDETFYRILTGLEVVGPSGNLGVVSLTNTGQAAFWEYVDGTRLGWKLLPSDSGLTAAFSTEVTVKINLDIHEIYTYPELGRTYELKEDSGGYILKYSDASIPRPLYLSIRTKGLARLTRSWNKREYPRDAARNSEPRSLFEFTALEVTTDSLAFGTAWSPDEARELGIKASRQRPTPPSIGINYTHDTLLSQVTTAKATTTQALRWLQTENGIWAGLPWFHQVWTRDELIAALGFSKQQQLQVIERYLGLPLIEGELPTFIGSGTTSSDGLGWLSLLVKEYGLENFSEDTTRRLTRMLKEAREQLLKHRISSGLVHSSHNATWMDTIGRVGFPLEIQTMYGLVLELLETITGEESYRAERHLLLRRIKRHYWHQGYLKDLLHDTALRPNVFLAYLFQPDLLNQQLWQTCFVTALKGLGLPWGGLASVALSDARYQPVSTGQNNISYHNGDSWFFINNLAAIALLRFSHETFGKTVVDLLQGSTDEILWENMVGMPGEISSATTLDSWGCGIQAFSGGTYLALLKEFEDYSATHDRASMSFFWDETADSKLESLLK